MANEAYKIEYSKDVNWIKVSGSNITVSPNETGYYRDCIVTVTQSKSGNKEQFRIVQEKKTFASSDTTVYNINLECKDMKLTACCSSGLTETLTFKARLTGKLTTKSGATVTSKDFNPEIELTINSGSKNASEDIRITGTTTGGTGGLTPTGETTGFTTGTTSASNPKKSDIDTDADNPTTGDNVTYSYRCDKMNITEVKNKITLKNYYSFWFNANIIYSTSTDIKPSD